MLGYKGFDKELKCRGFQFEIGKKFVHDGVLKLCNSGFHFVEYPLDMFNYYSPGLLSRFASVEVEGVTDEIENDSKRVGKSLEVKAEISFHTIVEAAIEFTFEYSSSS